jgi:hypothetical protein
VARLPDLLGSDRVERDFAEGLNLLERIRFAEVADINTVADEDVQEFASKTP